MDYSLLLTITTNPEYYAMKNRSGAPCGKEQRKKLIEHFNANKKNRHTFLSKNCQFIYHLGIIDYLQDYHFEKKAENFLKETLLQRSSHDAEISAVHPKRYAPRFTRFMAAYVIVDQHEGNMGRSQSSIYVKKESLGNLGTQLDQLI